ncbi:MAG: DAK2 domain-containing protein, partial [Erysipelotrichaceae bacterium]|nr:DAK2 domain-containing protein [Erysipelotrichaceae bacterium]
MKILDAQSFREMIESGAANLSNHANEVDSLNVFPVPDGDTGTNMSMTVDSGYAELMNSRSDSVSDLAKAFSKGLLMGARGNSGVITSQIFRGFYQSVEGNKELTAKMIAEGFENGTRVAYKAIMKPVEGTILTVIREASWYANHDFESKPDIDINEYFANLLRYAEESLDRTPDLLPILKEVGVIDSGGKGLVRIIEGFKLYVDGKPVISEKKTASAPANVQALIENEEFGYCTEFILRLNEDLVKKFDDKILRQKLTDMGGESLVVVKDDDLVKVHVHTLKPGEALNIGQRYGEFIKLKIENMQEQHSTIIESARGQEKEEPVEEEAQPEAVKQPKKYGIVTVAAGEGITKLFYDMNADKVISGGQTMNPSTEDFVKVIEELDHCEHIFIFPNNSNIILAAKQAQNVLSDRKITVMETKSVQAGLSAVGMFDS